MTVKDQLIAELDKLSPEQQTQLLEQVRAMTKELPPIEGIPTKPPPGVKSRDLLKFRGTLSQEEAEKMMADIEEAFEQVNLDEC